MSQTELAPYKVSSNPSELKFKGSTATIHDKISYVSLVELETSSDLNSLFKVFLGKVIYYKRVKVNAKRDIYNRTRDTSKENNEFDRTLVVMCLNSPPVQYRAIITLNTSKADIAFGQYLKARDEMDGFGPGATVAFARPSPIDNYFGDKHGLPVLAFYGGMKLVDVAKSGLEFPLCKTLEDVARLQSFYYPTVKLEITNCGVAHTTCVGFLCDSIGMKKADNNWRRECPCYSLKKQTGYALLDLDFIVKVHDEKRSSMYSFTSINFTSRSFTAALTTGGIPLSINQNMLQRCGADVEIIFKVHALIMEINSKGGFSVLGWCRQGRIDSKSQTSDPSGNKSKETVASSALQQHITKIEMNCARSDISSSLLDVAKVYNDCCN